jgi:hypothetical protein
MAFEQAVIITSARKRAMENSPNICKTATDSKPGQHGCRHLQTHGNARVMNN